MKTRVKLIRTDQSGMKISTGRKMSTTLFGKQTLIRRSSNEIITSELSRNNWRGRGLGVRTSFSIHLTVPGETQFFLKPQNSSYTSRHFPPRFLNVQRILFSDVFLYMYHTIACFLGEWDILYCRCNATIFRCKLTDE